MSTTDLAIVQNQIQTYWSPIFTKRLRESHLLAGLVNKEYEGSIAKGGDTVKVSQIVDLNGQLLTVGTNGDTFDTEQLTTTQISIKADKRAVAALEFADLVELQSQINRSQVQDTMLFALESQINSYLYGLVAPTTTVTGVTAMDVANLGLARKYAGQKKWLNDGKWFALFDPSYWADMLTNTTLASSLYVEDAPIVSGQKARRLFGFNMYEDNSQPKSGTSYGLFAHPDFLHYVEQQAVQVKISDLHGQGKFGFKMSVDIIFGAALGIQGADKHYKVTNP